ncbi:DUF4962 domain-containing protein [Lacihabitans sp. LS3-19]|uniref:heparinase II/III domain-containing protein n=1 Tax=Lacihabitans sp. LS3-19 TaxID=2487335 RepID=UPI0020CD3343|nr:heparinase II/III family protein [Lacihabitans sp. LS3-19]MCP9770570.1 DUF4962 domain-containing protein [Lacihabitans sp. LS3-19]
MKKTLVLFLSLIRFVCSGQTIAQTDFPTHPRLMLLKGEENTIIENIAKDKSWAKIHAVILAESNKFLKEPELERIQIGRRLLSVSREAIRRIFFLSYAYRITKEPKYLEKAEKEMLKIAQFSDWNPSHFLDVAEMTLGVSIGYDWLYNDLSATSRNIIEEAILKKGIEPSLNPEYNSWLKASHNWNQVCNAGISFGAIAIQEDTPELTKTILERAISSIKLPMEDFQPDGAYPEGYSYWDYGTSFNVLFINALQKIFNNDFGLIKSPGFLKTAAYFEHMIGTSGLSFNYSDAGNDTGLSPAMFWFAAQKKQVELLFNEKTYLDSPENMAGNRLLPAAMIWGASLGFENISAPKELTWTGQGKNPVVMMRTSWTDSEAIFVGFKAGSPSVNHGHMDVGSFVLDAQGERWAMDFGMQNYNSLESKGVALWDKTQNSQRWDIYRYNNLAHNTLTFDNKYQVVEGKAEIEKTTTDENFLSVQSDISAVFKNQINSAKRGIVIVDKSYVVFQDEIETSDSARTLKWTMVTPAKVKILNDQSAELKINNKTMNMNILGLKNAKLKTWSTTPTHDYDALNPGTKIIGFEVIIPPNSRKNYAVIISQEKIKKPKLKPLKNW